METIPKMSVFEMIDDNKLILSGIRLKIVNSLAYLYLPLIHGVNHC